MRLAYASTRDVCRCSTRTTDSGSELRNPRSSSPMVIRIGIIGVGNIFPAYLNTLRKQRKVRIVGIADAQPAVAEARAVEFALKAMRVDELLAGPAQIVLN